MSRVDGNIIEFMAECDSGEAMMSPKVIAVNINYDRSYVNNRLRQDLVPRGLVEDIGNALYRLTDLGRLAAEGEISSEDLDDLEK